MKPPERKPGFFSKKVSLPLWLVSLAIILMIGLLIGVISKGSSSGTAQNTSSTTASTPQSSNATQPAAAATKPPTPTPSPTPTQAPQWTTVQTFTGNGIKKTQIFQVGNDWKILWSCDPSSFYGGQYNIQVYVYDSNNNPLDVAVNTICKAGNTSDSTEEHQAGNIYLEIDSEGSWKIQVQELQ